MNTAAQKAGDKNSGVTGGPLGAVVGGHTNATDLYEEIFSKGPTASVRAAFHYFGFS